MFNPDKFFNTENNIYIELFKNTDSVWEGLDNISFYLSKYIKPNISKLLKDGPLIKKTVTLPGGATIYAGAVLMDENIELGPDVKVEPGACISGPTIIGSNTEIRQGAYVRGNVIAGQECVIGHATEIKNSVMLGKSKAGHFAYIGDSILGEVNLGAGTKLANLKLNGGEVTVSCDGRQYRTGRRKFGAILGDGVQTGCNCVTLPGTIMSKNVLTYPNTTAGGYYSSGEIIKLRQNIEKGKTK